MKARTTLAVLLLIAALAGCGGNTDDQPITPTPGVASTAAEQSVPPEPSISVVPVPSVVQSFAAAPPPNRATVRQYIADLNAIDIDIVHGDVDTAVNRGRAQCASIAQFPKDTDRLLKLVNERFTSPRHPNGFGDTAAVRILLVIRQHLCQLG